MSRRTIPTTGFAFNEWQHQITLIAEANAVKWGLDTDWITKTLIPAKSTWQSKWAICQNTATRTRLGVFEKNSARKKYEPLLRILVGNLEYNTKVTDDDRLKMGLIIRPLQRVSVPVPTAYPHYSIGTGTIRSLTINFRDHNKTTKAKPTGVSGAIIRWALLDTPPTCVEDLVNAKLDTASPFTVNFEENQRGKKVYICLAWQNTKGEIGPWSEIGAAIIP